MDSTRINVIRKRAINLKSQLHFSQTASVRNSENEMKVETHLLETVFDEIANGFINEESWANAAYFAQTKDQDIVLKVYIRLRINSLKNSEPRGAEHNRQENRPAKRRVPNHQRSGILAFTPMSLKGSADLNLKAVAWIAALALSCLVIWSKFFSA